MVASGADSAVRLSARSYTAADLAAVLSLVADDRGQPETISVMLTEALEGRSPVGGERWAELDTPHTEVARDQTGRLLGVVSYTTRRTDGAGLILWLHTGEDLAVARALVEMALSRLGRRTLYAFELPVALSLGLRGLPVRSRPATRKALEGAGFSTCRQRRYFHRILPRREDASEIRTYPIAEVAVTCRPSGGRLCLREPDGALIGEAVVAEPVDGIGVLRWIAIDPEHGGRGLGANLTERHSRREPIARSPGVRRGRRLSSFARRP